ncbi:hypothetical protein FACHB389_25970 [Nostoc calcicola FACHB-389]|nr:hypothetical protein [Nostoc calcicola FACHB-3891]OKH29667.1 hypothetical protein FACHB389_25970 [Nostoc calcicola FACHB-389]
MTIFQFFTQNLDELARHRKNLDIYEAIRAWCLVIPFTSNEKEVTQEIIGYVEQWIDEAKKRNKKNGLIWIINRFLVIEKNIMIKVDISVKELVERLDIVKGNGKSYLQQSERYQDEKTVYYYQKEYMMEVKIVLLVAFALAGAGLLLYLLKQGQNDRPKQKSELDQNENLPSTPAEDNSAAVQGKHILILVIDARKETVLQSLRENKKIVQGESQALYDATKALLTVKKSHFDQSTELTELKKWFSKDRAVPEAESSEYDIYLVKIELSQDVPGFGINVNAVERYNAFRNLPELVSGEVEISPRLPSAAYKNIGVYNNA